MGLPFVDEDERPRAVVLDCRRNGGERHLHLVERVLPEGHGSLVWGFRRERVAAAQRVEGEDDLDRTARRAGRTAPG